MGSNFDRVMDERKKLVDQIVENMKNGYIIPKAQWNAAAFQIHNPISGARYHGANMLKLYLTSFNNGYQDNRWMTFKQAASKGYHVKQGEKGIRLEKYIFDKVIEKENPDTGEMEKVRVKLSKPMINTFVVFNAEQIDGIPELVPPEIKQQDSEIWDIADNLIASSECPVKEEPQGKAYYSPQTDSITLPPREVFTSPEAFTTTLIHEMCHSTGHESRLNRNLINSFGSPEYALEELRAELGAFFMGSDLGIEGSEELLASHTQYLESWISVLENDPNELFRAMSDSQKAVDRLSVNLDKYQEQIKEQEANQDISTVQEYEDFCENHHETIKAFDRQSVVINAFGGPGSGKSVSCMDICHQLKKRGYNAEYVQEYAKELVYEENWELLDGSPEHQFEMLKEQLGRVDRLYGKVDFIVTDSPILLNGVYNKSLTRAYDQMVTSLYKDFENFTYFVERDSSSYQQEGRIQDLAESQKIDQDIKSLLRDKDIYYGTYNHQTIDKIVDNSIETFHRINSNEAAHQPVKMDLDEYLGSKGLSSPMSNYALDKIKIPHGETYRQQQKRIKDTENAIEEYSQRRNSAIEEYNSKVEAGEIVPRTTMERTLLKAQGHPDNASTQAARRLLVKRGFMSEMELNENIKKWDEKIPQKVAIESTHDYSEPGFTYMESGDMPAGTKYRLVTIGEKGSLVPYEPNVIFTNRDEIDQYIEEHKEIDVIAYDDMVYQAGAKKSEYTMMQHQIIDNGLHSFEFEDGYLYFGIDVNDYSYDGLYRIYDPLNGKSRIIINITCPSNEPVITENIDYIKSCLDQYVNEHPQIGLDGKPVPRERPTIYCEWSEHGAFQEETVYDASEFNKIMERVDQEKVNLNKRIASLGEPVATNIGNVPLIDYLDIQASNYGYDSYETMLDEEMSIGDYSYVTKELIDKWRHNEQYLYDKVKYEVYVPGMTEITVRQNIGDGFGSVKSFLQQNGYQNYAEKLTEWEQRFSQIDKVTANIPSEEKLNNAIDKVMEQMNLPELDMALEV